MTKYRWRMQPDILARLIDTGGIQTWGSRDLVLKPNEAVTIIADGKIQDTLSETVLKSYTGGWGRWLGSRIGLGSTDHKLLFTMTGPFDLLFLIDGQLGDGSHARGMAALRLQFNREDCAKLLNVFANGPRLLDRGFFVRLYERELEERVIRPLLAEYADGRKLHGREFQDAFEMSCRAEMRGSFGLAGLTLLKAYCTVNQTDVERLAAYQHQAQLAQDSRQVDADASLAQLERARAATLARIEMENDIAHAQARGKAARKLEHELKNLRKHEASLHAEREHAQGMADVRVGEQEAELQSAMVAFTVVQQKKQERLRMQAKLNGERQEQTDVMQREMMQMAAEKAVLTPEVMLEFLKQQTKQKEADK